jgi:hypothetical protein
MKSAMDDSLEHTHPQNPKHPGHLVKHNFLLFPAERFFLGESDFLQNGPYMWNRKWIVQTFGLPFYHALSRASIRGDGGDVMFPILCGGLYAGSVEAMIDFFDLFVASTIVLGGCGTNDQGLLNGLVAVGLFVSPHPVFISDPYTSLFTNGPRDHVGPAWTDCQLQWRTVRSAASIRQIQDGLATATALLRIWVIVAGSPTRSNSRCRRTNCEIRRIALPH